MHGVQLVDQASSTTTLPFCSPTSFSDSSQSTIFTEIFDLAASVFPVSFAGFSSPATLKAATEKNRHKQTWIASFREVMRAYPCVLNAMRRAALNPFEERHFRHRWTRMNTDVKDGFGTLIFANNS